MISWGDRISAWMPKCFFCERKAKVLPAQRWVSHAQWRVPPLRKTRHPVEIASAEGFRASFSWANVMKLVGLSLQPLQLIQLSNTKWCHVDKIYTCKWCCGQSRRWFGQQLLLETFRDPRMNDIECCLNVGKCQQRVKIINTLYNQWLEYTGLKYIWRFHVGWL